MNHKNTQELEKTLSLKFTNAALSMNTHNFWSGFQVTVLQTLCLLEVLIIYVARACDEDSPMSFFCLILAIYNSLT